MKMFQWHLISLRCSFLIVINNSTDNLKAQYMVSRVTYLTDFNQKLAYLKNCIFELEYLNCCQVL